jgi:hypothetical protein
MDSWFVETTLQINLTFNDKGMSVGEHSFIPTVHNFRDHCQEHILQILQV